MNNFLIIYRIKLYNFINVKYGSIYNKTNQTYLFLMHFDVILNKHNHRQFLNYDTGNENALKTKQFQFFPLFVNN